MDAGMDVEKYDRKIPEGLPRGVKRSVYNQENIANGGQHII